MISFINLAVLFAAKVADNALSTTKTILVQRSRWILAGIAVIISDFIYFWITKRVVSADNELAMLVVAVAGGVGLFTTGFWILSKLYCDGVLNVYCSTERNTEECCKKTCD